ncbi:hypothetical protein B0H14DRAFT_2618582 [Mycena olivaceomarginata]|nr:hypothetical protein B0H14DRAFT_2618582 [Mycena olivaceomarginata]
MILTIAGPFPSSKIEYEFLGKRSGVLKTCAQMTSEAAVFPVSVTSDNVQLICGGGENSTRFLSRVLQIKPLHYWLCQMGSWAYTNYPFHQLIDISSAVDFSLLDNIFVIQGSSVKVLFIDNSAIMGLDCAAREAVIFAPNTISQKSSWSLS